MLARGGWAGTLERRGKGIEMLFVGAVEDEIPAIRVDMESELTVALACRIKGLEVARGRQGDFRGAVTPSLAVFKAGHLSIVSRRISLMARLDPSEKKELM